MEEVIQCSICETPIEPTVPRMQRPCMHWCHSVCGMSSLLRTQLPFIQRTNGTQKECTLCETNDVDELQEQRQVIRDWMHGLHTDLLHDGLYLDIDVHHQPDTHNVESSMKEILDVEDLEFKAACKEYVKSVRAKNKAERAYNRVIHIFAGKYKTNVAVAKSIIVQEKKTTKALISQSPEAKEYTKAKSRSSRQLTMLKRRFTNGTDDQTRTLQQYLRKTYKLKRSWYYHMRPQWYLRRQLRLKL